MHPVHPRQPEAGGRLDPTAGQPERRRDVGQVGRRTDDQRQWPVGEVGGADEDSGEAAVHQADQRRLISRGAGLHQPGLYLHSIGAGPELSPERQVRTVGYHPVSRSLGCDLGRARQAVQHGPQELAAALLIVWIATTTRVPGGRPHHRGR